MTSTLRMGAKFFLSLGPLSDSFIASFFLVASLILTSSFVESASASSTSASPSVRSAAFTQDCFDMIASLGESCNSTASLLTKGCCEAVNTFNQRGCFWEEYLRPGFWAFYAYGASNLLSHSLDCEQRLSWLIHDSRHIHVLPYSALINYDSMNVATV